MKAIIVALLILPAVLCAQDPKNANVIFSRDGGINWSDGDDGLPSDVIVSCYAAVAKSIFIGTEKDGLYRYEKNTWRRIMSGSDAGKISAIFGDEHKILVSTAQQGIRVSADDGATWTHYKNDLHGDRIRRFIQVNDNLIIGGDNGIYLSTQGRPWEHIIAGVQVNKFMIYRDKIYAATAKGILCSDDNGKHWNTSWQRRTVLDFSIQKNKLVGLLGNSDVVTLLDNDSWLEVTPFLKYLYTVRLTPLSAPVLRHDFQSPMIRNAQFHPLIMFRESKAPTYMLDTPEGLMLIVWINVVGC
ncbi:WD40/YVTN/BNR-like repeat-containing protein [Pseudochryseolinea flava]|uniref:Photosynthesis system II assembly factor Ycf48/Hcf136-like domain-containing protein n=1 Tax=Pseudochryseolinea flava TaxID=2059302 RepID=A0A364XZG7_9BACT|nr:hypothetical protein [Pseudochryseolinea flava]RAV99720.1 hypothetical protein DQQ10_16840 [Pseudochryseolinea flava]